MGVADAKFLDGFASEYRLAYYPTEVMQYFEKYHIFEIVFDLMVMLVRDRPQCIEQYIADNISAIARKYIQINSFISIPDTIDIDRFRTTLESSGRCCPIIEAHPSEMSLLKLSEHLKRVNLEDKNLIFLGDTESLKLVQENRYVHMAFRAPTVQLLGKLHAEVVERSKLLKISPPHSVVRYVPRILVLGRPGCGKHRLARWLSQRLNACLVSATDLVSEHERKMDCFGRALDRGSQQNVHTSELFASIVQLRLLQSDCLGSGWVLVDFPNTADDVLNFFKSLITPQKVLLIDTDEAVCRRRKLLQRKMEPACWKNMMLETELKFYNLHQQDVLEAIEQQVDCAILQVDGNRSYGNIQKSILRKLMIHEDP